MSDNTINDLGNATSADKGLKEGVTVQKWAQPLPDGFVDIDDYIAEIEKDPLQRARLDIARQELYAMFGNSESFIFGLRNRDVPIEIKTLDRLLAIQAAATRYMATYGGAPLDGYAVMRERDFARAGLRKALEP